MGPSVIAETATSVDSTRQQLDELEGLLRRMLDLPVIDLQTSLSTPVLEPWQDPAERAAGSDAAPAAEPVPARSESGQTQATFWAVATRAQPAQAQTHQSAGPTSAMEASDDHPDQAEQPRTTGGTQSPPGESQEPAHATKEGPIPKSLSDFDRQPLVPVQAPDKSYGAAPTFGPALLLLPLVVVNSLFDFGTFLLGPPGRWLRTNPGRAFIAWSGLVLWLAALAWAGLQWMGLDPVALVR
jgi:hypothetical protein